MVFPGPQASLDMGGQGRPLIAEEVHIIRGQGRLAQAEVPLGRAQVQHDQHLVLASLAQVGIDGLVLARLQLGEAAAAQGGIGLVEVQQLGVEIKGRDGLGAGDRHDGRLVKGPSQPRSCPL